MKKKSLNRREHKSSLSHCIQLYHHTITNIILEILGGVIMKWNCNCNYSYVSTETNILKMLCSVVSSVRVNIFNIIKQFIDRKGHAYTRFMVRTDDKNKTGHLFQPCTYFFSTQFKNCIHTMNTHYDFSVYTSICVVEICKYMSYGIRNYYWLMFTF